MAQVDVRINGRQYQVACEDGQEAHLDKLANYIDQRVAELVKEVGQVGDARLLVMAGLLIADELADAYDELSELRAVDSMPRPPDPDTVRAAEAARNAAAAAEARAATAELTGEQIAAGLEALTARVAALADRIERERA